MTAPLQLYIAGPMRGYPSFNFPAFYQAEGVLLFLGHCPLNPARKDAEAGFDWEGYLGTEDLASLGFSLRSSLADDLTFICLEADGIVVLPRWYQSSGARAEVATARALSLPVYYITYDEANRPSLTDVTAAAYRMVS